MSRREKLKTPQKMDTDDGVADKRRRSSRKTMATGKDEDRSEVRRRSSRQTMKSPSPAPEASKRPIAGPKAAAVGKELTVRCFFDGFVVVL